MSENQVDRGSATDMTESAKDRARQNKLMDSLFDDDSGEDYTIPPEHPDGPGSLDEYFSAALHQSESEDSGSGEKLFDDDSALESELDKAFNKIVKTQDDEPKSKGSDDEPKSKSKDADDEPKSRAKDEADEPKSRAKDEDVESKNKPKDEATSPPQRSTLEQNVPSSLIPEWCNNFSFPELKELNSELADLNKVVRETRSKLEAVADRIRLLSELKNALLSLTGVKLTRACCTVFEELGWTVRVSESRSDEIYLQHGESVTAIVRIVSSTGQPKISDVTDLAESVIRYWSKHDREPKGMLLASTFIEEPPRSRSDENFSAKMRDFAERKDISLMTCMQLLSIYRDVATRNADKRRICKKLVANIGTLPECRFETVEEGDEEPIQDKQENSESKSTSKKESKKSSS